MHAFDYRGQRYKSLKDFSAIHKVSYQKLRRLCRHYKKAQEDPAMACDWLLGRKNLDPRTEVKTVQYYRDLALSRVRHARFISHAQADLIKNFSLV